MADDRTPMTDAALNFAVDLLRKDPARTPARIHEVAELGVKVAALGGASVDVDALAAELRHLFSIEIEAATILEDHDPREHLPWLLERKAQIPWRFWRRYMMYLERDFGMAPASVNALDVLTDMVLGRLEDPQRDGAWDRRGMVVGSVQSGKTANYTGLICKAIDSGYKLVIVLAGIHSNLRSQTQLRIDEGVLGFDTQKSRQLNSDSHRIGVGRIPGETLHIHSLTTSAEDGDFNKRVADAAGFMLGGNPIVLVVKKNSRLLGNLLMFLRRDPGAQTSGSEKKVIRNVPFLLIDDEADNASIDTTQRTGPNANLDTVTAINGGIRDLLATFEKASYVGYTATPFANIFVNPDAQSDKHGDDIFPRSFIVNVKPPSNYVGPAKVFGLAGDTDAGIQGSDGVPIIRTIADHDDPDHFPPGHKKEHVPTALPPSLRKAIRCFILTCAARRARGQQSKHNSMLVHVTRFMNVQDRVVALVRDELLPLQRRLQFGDGERSPSLVDELRTLWEDEFVPTTLRMGEDAGLHVTWAQVVAELHPAASRILVMTINGSAKEVLDYKVHEAVGLSVIAVGGDKLSRGLTLEGLSVSYFLRTSRMYDTLMQMGRWFGYRPGYLDLCRLFTTRQLVDWYRHIALAEVELRREFDYMVAAGREPRDYGLRVRTHPDGMIVTALNKMCHSQVLNLSWGGVLAQTTHLPKDDARVNANLAAAERLLLAIGRAPRREANEETMVWVNVPAAAVADYVEEVQLPVASARAAGQKVAEFIRTQATRDPPELTTWTVALVSNPQAPVSRRTRIAGFDVGLIGRTPEDGSETADAFAARKANILSPRDEARDLRYLPYSTDAIEAAAAGDVIAEDARALGPGTWNNLEEFAVDITKLRFKQGRLRGKTLPQLANGRVVREVRPKTHGLLLLYPIARQPTGASDQPEPSPDVALDGSPCPTPIMGHALSFPASDSVGGVEYRVNRVWDKVIEDDAGYED